MPAIQIVFAVLGALLAVVGVYAILREWMLSAIASREVTVAVILREPVDAVTLDLLLDEATRHPMRRRGRRVALIIPRPLEGNLPLYAEVIERYAADVLVVEGTSIPA